jgi:proton glutamate symport protein
MASRRASRLAVASAGVAVLLLISVTVLDLLHLPETLFTGLRWVAIALLVFYAWRRRSLTTWILVSMVIGAEIGHDWPQVAVNLRVLSMIFLRLIKTIIAPLIFATLVVGIASHSDLKQVGRMGVKALIYSRSSRPLPSSLGWRPSI